DTWFRLSDGRQVHVECFSCQGCGALIDDGVYVLDAGVEFHPQCVPPAPPPVVVSVSPVPSEHSSSQGRVRGPRAPRRDECCDRCAAVLTGPRFQLTNGKQYHPQCFACAGCGQRFDEGSYVCFEGHEYHHHCVDTRHNNSSSNQPPRQQQQQQQEEDEEDALVCAQCRKSIEGVFLRHNDAVFHPPCFCCNDCRRPITPGMPFGEIDARPCCESCLERRASSAQIPMPQHYQHQHQRQHQQQPQQQYY
ncbi:LIM and senescent cell antigen-like-containing domain protein 2, partial [Coemansia sp. RSA 2424]